MRVAQIYTGSPLGGEDASGSDLPIGDQALSTMPDVFAPLDVPLVRAA